MQSNIPKLLLVAVLILTPTQSSAATVYTEEAYQYNYSLDDNAEDECSDLDDPYEKLNRKIFAFNSVMDHLILKPIAKGYKAIFNSYSRDKIGNFIDNTNVPLSFVNNALQLDTKNTLLSFWQFAINSTLGVGGLYDVSAQFGLKTSPQTFGSTLARYGVAPGPYIILPFYGGSGARDVLDKPVLNSGMNPLKYKLHHDFRIGLLAANVVHQRAELLSFTDYVEKNSPDPYSIIRSSIHQYREKDLRYPLGYRCKRFYTGTNEK